MTNEITFTEYSEKYLASIFNVFKTNGALVSYITDGFPKAIAANLHRHMLEEIKKSDPDEELSVEVPFNLNGKNIMTFRLKRLIKGDGAVNTPEFELGEYGQKLIDDDEFEVDPADIRDLGNEICNLDIINDFTSAYATDVYSNGEWKRSTSTDPRGQGIMFEYGNEDTAAATAAVIYSIISILCNNKKPDKDIEYTIDGLGKFKVSPSKNGYNVTLVFDKEFKATCKTDSANANV